MPESCLRRIQSRVFDTNDRPKLLKTVEATLQDLGYTNAAADPVRGFVSGYKRNGIAMYMRVDVNPQRESQMMVRVYARLMDKTAEFKLLQPMEEPEFYQHFFKSLSNRLFLEARQLD